MRENGFATDAEVEAARSTPLLLGSSVVPAAQHYTAPHLVEEVKQWILDDPRFGATPQARRDLLFGGGLQIHTTVDLAAQHLAEQAIAEVLADPSDRKSTRLNSSH